MIKIWWIVLYKCRFCKSSRHFISKIMNLFQILELLLTVNIVHAKVNCNLTHRYVKNRADVRDKINSNDLSFAIVDYAVLRNFSVIKDYSRHIRFLTDFNNELKSPAIAVYLKRMQWFEMYIYSNNGDIAMGYLNFTFQSMEINNDFLKNEQCANQLQLGARFWFNTWSKEPHCFLLFTCEILHSTEGSYLVRPRLIFLADENHNQSMVNFYLSKKNYTRKFAKFSEFESSGICICNDIEYYLNDCEEKEVISPDSEDHYHFVIFSLVFIGLFVNYEIYWFLIGSEWKFFTNWKSFFCS